TPQPGLQLTFRPYTCGEATFTPTPTNTSSNTPTNTLTPTRTQTPTNTPTPCVDQYFDPQPGAPENGGTVAVGQKFILDLRVNSGQYYITAQQAYLTFTNSLLQNVNVGQS